MDDSIFLAFQRIREERDPWRITAIASEAVARFIATRGDAHNAAECAMSAYAACVDLDHLEMAHEWLRGLQATESWPLLIGQTFFVQWLGRVAPSLVGREAPRRLRDVHIHADANLGDTPVTTRCNVQSEEDLLTKCRTAARDLEGWLVQSGASEMGIGGLNVLAALNRSRWRAAGRHFGECEIGNAAAFGLSFVPGATDPDRSTALAQVLEGAIRIVAVTLGTDASEGSDVPR